ncbi:MAG: hypothetical protein GY816_21940 [Cytophagales bacterium]|nr:hypothetical protein [Cytophagales bacterium]
MSRINSFDKYSRKVFRLEESLPLLKDTRKEPDIDIGDIFRGYYFGSALRMKATSTIEEEIREGVLKKRVKQNISDDTFGYGLSHLEPQSLQQFWYMLIKRAKRNGMLRDNPFLDYSVGVLDGIETFSSYYQECDNCLTRKVTKKNKKNGKEEFVEMIQYYHRAVVLTLVGYDFPIPVGLEMMRKGEDEINCALRLLKRIVNNLGVRFLDIVIGDALYCTPNFFKECKLLGIYAGAVLKDNQENLLETALAQKKITEPVIVQKKDKEELKLWDLKEVIWDTANTDARVLWADRKVWERDPTKQGNKGKRGNLHHWVEKKNVFAFSEDINLPPEVVYSIGRHRWDIDANIFMDIVKHCHLKHKTLHFVNAYENMLSIRLISYMLFRFFFHRHINSRRKEKIASPAKMVRMMYRDACLNIEPETVLLE